MEKVSLLKSVFVFSGLDDKSLNQMSELLVKTPFSAGQTVFNEGKSADAFYVIGSGDITISKKIGQGKEKTLSMLGPGSVFGEMAFFSDSPRIADATAKTDSILWKI